MSSLLELCKQFTEGAASHLPSEHAIGKRLVCPEYSKSEQEVKTYPFINNDKIIFGVLEFYRGRTASFYNEALPLIVLLSWIISARRQNTAPYPRLS